MRAQLTSILLAAIAFTAAACDPPLPPVPPAPPRSETGAPIATDNAPGAMPDVVRRLVTEAQEQMSKDSQMAAELPDPHGRLRAIAETDRLASELADLAVRLNNDPSSSDIDDVMRRLSALNPRIDDLHDALRTATERTSAVAGD